MLDEEVRRQCLKRCLNDEQLPLDVRAAGALVALYGLTVSKIIRLRPTDFRRRDAEGYLNIDASPLPLPPRLASIVDRLIDIARPGGAIGRTAKPTT